MGKEIFLVLILIILIVIIIGAINSEEPVELSISHTSCLGGNFCFIGETMEMKIKLNQNEEDVGLNSTPVKIDSDIKEFVSVNQEVFFGEETIIPIQIPTELNPDDYKFKVSLQALETNNPFLKIKRFFSKEYMDEKIINIRYPKVELTLHSPKKDNLQKIYDIYLANKDSISLNCKQRIEVSPDVSLTHDSIFEISRIQDMKIIYESEYENISPTENSNCCNSININANSIKAEAQIKIIPVCKFDESEVQIKDEIKIDRWRHDAREI